MQALAAPLRLARRGMMRAVSENRALPQRVKDVLLHPAGVFHIHFWAPAWKWGLVVAGIADLKRPAESISRPQSTALALTGCIWSRYATQIVPVNYNLLSVNVFVGLTGVYQLYRSFSHEMDQAKLAEAEGADKAAKADE